MLYIDLGQLRHGDRDLGQVALDRFLLTVTRELREIAGTKALLARWGDREFAALIPDARPLQLTELGATAEKALKNLPLGDGSDAGDPRRHAAAHRGVRRG